MHNGTCGKEREWKMNTHETKKKVCIVYDERSPEGTEVRNECHKRNDIQFILPIVCFFLSHGLNTENFSIFSLINQPIE